MSVPVKVIAKPVDASRCTLVLSRPVRLSGVRRYTAGEDTGDAPVARALLGVAGVTEVVVAGDELTVTKGASGPPWSDLVAQLRYAVRAAMEQPDPLASAAPAGLPDDDEVYRVAEHVCRTEINAWVAQHGGKVELVDVQDGSIVLRMSGGCQGCGMARVTLTQGIEAALRRAIPGLRGLRDVTDHEAGSRPYFRPSGG
jgi:NFU1 iron-sulfur cluster scaffold homolog, mitochondrial